MVEEIITKELYDEISEDYSDVFQNEYQLTDFLYRNKHIMYAYSDRRMAAMEKIVNIFNRIKGCGYHVEIKEDIATVSKNDFIYDDVNSIYVHKATNGTSMDMFLNKENYDLMTDDELICSEITYNVIKRKK